MKTREDTVKALNSIREAVDADVIDTDIINVQNKLLKLTQIIGLSSEAKASAKKLLHIKEKEIFLTMDKKLQPSIQIKILNAECFEELAILDYADRLNSAIVHNIDALRSIISLYKTEMENSLK